MSRPALLLVDDRQDNLDSQAMSFSRSDYDVVTALGGKAALDLMKARWFDVVVTDLKMPHIDGLDVVRAARSQSPPSAVIVITAHGSIPTVVEALREGAVDYLTKPVDLYELRRRVEELMEKQRRVRDGMGAAARPRPRFRFDNMIADSEAMGELFDRARRAAESRATVLITGESGTGKEMLARAIHKHSPFSGQPFVAVHCAALSDALVESELFGHEKGAYTGAEAARPGRFEIAAGGTLFLDEVGEIPLSTQVKLLRVLESREFERVGGVQTLTADARVVAATNRDLEAEVAAGRFREDLYYRLSVVRFRIPPLRERPDDIPLMVQAFLFEFASDENTRLLPEALDRLREHAWPGNARELRNVIEGLGVMKRGREIGVGDLPGALGGPPDSDAQVRLRVGMSLDDVEQKMIEETLRAVDGNRTRAAELLGVSRRTLQRKLREEAEGDMESSEEESREGEGASGG